MTHNKQMIRSAGIISIATLGSRILGMIRDLMMAWVFGAGWVADAFFGAFMFPNLFRRIFGEGAMQAAVVPVLSEKLEDNDHHALWAIAARVINILAVILVCLVIVVFMIIAVIRATCALDDKSDLLLQLLYLLFPYVIFICLAAAFMSILNTFRHFMIPALFPIVLNIFWIIAIVSAAFLPDWPLQKRIWIVALGIFFAGVFQMAMHIPVLRTKGMPFVLTLDRHHPGVKKIGRLFLPVMFGTAIIPINVFITRFIAHFLGVGIQSALYFSERFVQIPLGLAATPIGQVILPELSRQASRRDFEALKKTFSFGLRATLFLTVPMMTGLIVLSEPIIRILFQHGAFDSSSTFMTSQALMYYSLGLFAYAVIRVITPVFYSLQDTKSPMAVAAFGMLCNIGFCFLLMRPMRGSGLALSMTLSSTIQMVLLFYLLHKKFDHVFELRSFWHASIRILAASGAMGLMCYHAFHVLAPLRSDTLSQVFVLLITIVLGVFLYLFFAKTLRAHELGELYEAFIAKKLKNR